MNQGVLQILTRRNIHVKPDVLFRPAPREDSGIPQTVTGKTGAGMPRRWLVALATSLKKAGKDGGGPLSRYQRLACALQDTKSNGSENTTAEDGGSKIPSFFMNRGLTK